MIGERSRWWERPSVRNGAVIIAGTVLILLPALVNGFPFVYPDTGTYLGSAFRGTVPIDRPYWYGVFMRLTSLGGNTFWGIITAQALLCSLYILRTVKVFVHVRTHLVTMIILVALALTSSVGWYAGQLMPDIFTGIGALALFHLLIGNGGRWVRFADGALVALCCWVHLSNLLILPLSGAVMVIVYRRSFTGRLRSKWATLAGMTILSWGGLAIANRTVDREFYLSRGGHAFMVAHMVDTGMLKAWLDEHCAEGAYRLCAYKDRLPQDSGHFLWTDSISPMHLEGGWLATGPEYRRIIRSTLTEPRYLAWHARSSFTSLARQLMHTTICVALQSNVYRNPDSPPYFMIEGTIRSAMPAYLSSLQNGGRGELSMRWPDRVYLVSTLGSLLIGLLLVFGYRAPDPAEARTERALMLTALAVVIIGCWVCSTLAVVDDRYLGRISWLLPLASSIVIARRWLQTGSVAAREDAPATR